MDTWVIIVIVAPLVLLDFGLKILAILDLMKNFEKRPKIHNYIWIAVILTINMFGWLSYLLFARMPKEKTDNDEDWG